MGAVPRDTDGDGLADTHNEVFGEKTCLREKKCKGGGSGGCLLMLACLNFMLTLNLISLPFLSREASVQTRFFPVLSAYLHLVLDVALNKLEGVWGPAAWSG